MSPADDKSTKLMLRYVPVEAPHLRALLDGDEAFHQLTGWTPAAGWLEFPQILPGLLSEMESGNIDEDWPAFFVIDSEASALIGMGGFKSAPQISQVEIGYGIAAAYRNRGVATRFTEWMCKLAFDSGMVTSVIAHTLVEENASSRVLTKAGFSLIGEIAQEGEDTHWRWQKTIR